MGLEVTTVVRLCLDMVVRFKQIDQKKTRIGVELALLGYLSTLGDGEQVGGEARITKSDLHFESEDQGGCNP